MNKFRIGDVVKVVKLIYDDKEYEHFIGKSGIVISFEHDNNPEMCFYEVAFDDRVNDFWPDELELVKTNQTRLADLSGLPVTVMLRNNRLTGKMMYFVTAQTGSYKYTIVGDHFFLAFSPTDTDILVLPADE